MPSVRLERELGVVDYHPDPQDAQNAIVGLLEGTEELGFDTETSGLDIYVPGYSVRLAQLGSKEHAVVWPVNESTIELTRLATTTRPVWYWNAPHDLLSLDRRLGITLEETVPYARDAFIVSKLVDPRGRKDGGTDHKLKEQSNEYLGLDVKDAREVLFELTRKKYGFKTIAEMWANVPLDDEDYLWYAGQDSLLTSRIGPYKLAILEAETETDLKPILAFEHRFLYDAMRIRRQGWELDAEYSLASAETLQKRGMEYDAIVASFGVPPTKSSGLHYSSTQLGDRLEELGAPFDTFGERTKTGWSTKKEVLAAVAGIPLDLATEEIAESDADPTEPQWKQLIRNVLLARKYMRMSTYCASFPQYQDENGRVHAVINTLAAKTGRMSVSEPPLQQLPRDVPEPRACFIAEPGHVLASCDYSSVEWRVAAGVLDSPNMRQAFLDDMDMHGMVADIVWPDGWTKAERQVVKIAGLGTLYGGGIQALMKQTGLSESKIREVKAAIDALFPEIKQRMREYDLHIKARIKDDLPPKLILSTGRVAITDKGYAALNYLCQGPARDLMARAIVRMFDEGMGQYIRMTIHDELVFSFPEDQATELLERARLIMETEFLGVKITAEAEIHGKRWKK